jgi:hypothetical protein
MGKNWKTKSGKRFENPQMQTSKKTEKVKSKLMSSKKRVSTKKKKYE